MLDQRLRTAGHWSDPTVSQKIVEQAAHILAARGADTWMDSFTRLNRRLHLSTGFLEHHTVTASIDRGRNPTGYTQARIAELEEKARGRAATILDIAARPSATPQRRHPHPGAAPSDASPPGARAVDLPAEPS
jgi:hypothetical protein